ncbi:hypothetical protein AgCh_031176 [Apium graveolens]
MGCFFGRLKIKRVPSIPASSPTKDMEEQSYQNSNVDIFTAAEADEIVADSFDQPSSTTQFTCQRENECREFSSINFKYSAPTSVPHWRREIQQLAATKIQKAFRGYLGIVRLQATIRGILVRRQAITTLSRLQSILNIQSQVRAKKSQMLDGSSCSERNKEVMDFKGNEIKIDLNTRRRWDDSLLTEEEKNDICSSKRTAAINRERIKEHSFGNRRSAELEQNKFDRRWRYWLEQWVDTRMSKREDLQNFASPISTRQKIKDYEPGVKLVKPQNLPKKFQYEESDFPATSSFHHRKQHSIATYMAATESAKAKVRSMSAPRQRPMSFDSKTKAFSPYKHKLSPISSISSELTTRSTLTRPSNGYSQRSPCLKGPIKSKRYSKFLSIN